MVPSDSRLASTCITGIEITNTSENIAYFTYNGGLPFYNLLFMSYILKTKPG